MLDEMTQRNTSKFAIFYTYENQKLLFSFRAILFFSLMNALVYVEIDLGIHNEKNKVARNEKKEKATLGFRI